MASEKEFPELQGIEQVSSGWINKYILKFRLPNGRDYQYEAVSRKPLDVYKTSSKRRDRWNRRWTPCALWASRPRDRFC